MVSDDSTWVGRLTEALGRLGDISGTLLYDPNHATHDAGTGLAGLAQTGSTVAFQLIFPSSPTVQWEFNGVVSRFNPTGLDANSGLVRADFAITPDGTGVTIN